MAASYLIGYRRVGCRRQTVDAAQTGAEMTCQVLPAGQIGIQAIQLRTADGGLEFGQSVVRADHVRQIGDAVRFDQVFCMVAYQLAAQGKLVVVGYQHAAFAGVDMLVIVEAKAADVAYRADRFAFVMHARCLGCVLDDFEAVLLGQRHDRVHVAGLAENMHQHDGLSARRNDLGDGGGTDVKAIFIDVGKNRDAAVK